MAGDFLGGITGGNLFGGIGTGSIFGLVQIFFVLFASILVIGGIIYFFYNRKQWNLNVEFKLPRGIKYLKEGEVLDINDIQGSIDSEWGKGSFNSRRGVVFLKRKKKRKVKMKPFNITRYLQGNTLTVVQVGADEYKPVLPESFLMYKDDQGNDCALLNLKTDTTESKAWAKSFERDAKQTFSVNNFLQEHQTAIMIGLVIFMWGIQFLLLYNRIKG